MKGYLKQFGVWEILVNPPNHPRRKTKASFEKDNKVALNFLMDGLSGPIKESNGKYTSTKDLWFNMEEEHQRRILDKKKEAEVQDEKQ